jgi:hypothetical protein
MMCSTSGIPAENSRAPKRISRKSRASGLICFLGAGLLLAALSWGKTSISLAGPLLDRANSSNDAGTAPWVPLRIVDVAQAPQARAYGGVSKILYQEERDGKVLTRFLYIDFPPTGVPKPPRPENRAPSPHYHPYHEWGYILGGDYVTYEYISPGQTKGELMVHRTGDWLDRPANSLHDGGTADGWKRQAHCYMLIYEEGDDAKDSVSFNPRSPEYKPDWKNVSQWTHPYRVQTLEQMEWEPDPDLPGASIKYLSEDQVTRLHFIPAKMVFPKSAERSYYKQAHRFVYVIWGDMNVWEYDSPNGAGKKITTTKDFSIDQPPMSIWGTGDGPITENGCMWLEVVYAKGTKVGGGPIEDASMVQ